jgi:hypothetical protein
VNVGGREPTIFMGGVQGQPRDSAPALARGRWKEAPAPPPEMLAKNGEGDEETSNEDSQALEAA